VHILSWQKLKSTKQENVRSSFCHPIVPYHNISGIKAVMLGFSQHVTQEHLEQARNFPQ
jgi:hypothetical protein